MSVDSRGNRTSALLLSLFLLLSSVYALTYTGVSISDDEQLYVSVAQNLAVRGEYRADQLYGNDRLDGQYAGTGILHPTLASQVYRLARAFSLGGAQSLFLLSAMYTVATALFVYLITAHYGASRRAAIIASLLFGLTTIAWPYASTFFREPLAMLLLMASWLVFIHANDKSRNGWQKSLLWILFLLLFLGAVFCKIMLLVAVPAYLILLLRGSNPFTSKNKTTLGLVTVFGVIISLSVLIVSTYDRTGQELGIIQRYSGFFLRFVIERITSISHTSLIEAVFGSLISPGKGILVYSPVLIISIFSIIIFWKKCIEMMLLPVIVFIGLIISQAIAYDHEWWNVTWSTRYLLPSVPLMIVASAPLIDRIISAPNKRKVIAFSLFVFICMLAQLGSVLVSPSLFTIHQYETLGAQFPRAAIWDTSQAAIIGLWHWILEGRELNVAWARGIETNPVGILLTMVALFGAFLVSAIILIRNSRLGQHTLATTRLQSFLQLIVLGFIPIATLSAYKYDPYYHYGQSNIESIQEVIANDLQSEDVIVLDPYLSGIWQYFLNFNFVDSVVYSLPLPVSDHVDPQTREVREWKRESLFSKLPVEFDRVWIIFENPPNFPKQAKERAYYTEMANLNYSKTFIEKEVLTLSLYTFE